MTLREYLDSIHIDSGNDNGFMVTVGNTDMQVSRRYLECPSWIYLLDRKIIDSYYNGWYTVFVLEDKD